jgi:Ig-like domain CHU_C associated
MKRCVTLLCFALSPIALAATSLQISIPAQTTTGAPFSITVTALDGESIDPSYTGTVHFTSTEETAVLPADYTFTPADGGTRTFTATFNRSNRTGPSMTHTVGVEDTSHDITAGQDDSNVFWAANVVRKLRIDVPEEVSRAVTFDGTVSALNAYDEVVTNYTGTVTFEGTAGVDLPPSYTFTAADNGVHTFTFNANLGGYRVVSAEDVADVSTGYADGFTVLCPEFVVSASNGGAVCDIGSQTTVSASSNHADAVYAWAGPGRNNYASGAEWTVNQPGTYWVTASHAATQCEAITFTEVPAKSSEAPQFSASASSVCPNETLTVSLTNASSFTDIEWFADNASIVSGQGTPSVVVSGSNPANIYVYATARESSANCPTGSMLAAAVPIVGVTAIIDTPAAACPNTTQTASVLDAGAGATYNWTIANGRIVSGQGTRAIQYAPLGSEVTLQATVAKQGCSVNDTAIVSVDGPTATVNGTFSICESDNVSVPVTLAGVPPFRIVWSDNVVQENITGTTSSRTFTGAQAGTYFIAQVSDAHCAGSASGVASVLLNDRPDINAQPRSTTIRPGEQTTLTVDVSGENLVYRWYEGSAGDSSRLVSEQLEPSFTTPRLTQTTKYWVHVSNGCGERQSHTATVTVTAGGGKKRSTRH